MLRGEIWVAAGREKFSNKPAPVLVVQRSIAIPVHQSIIVCRITSDIQNLPFMRVRIVADENNGLKVASDVMADKVLTLRKADLSEKIGCINAEQLSSLDELLFFWMGL
jgi:mRNA interferase MazF